MTPGLEIAIAVMYEAFSCEPKPSAIPWCTCPSCAHGQNASTLLTKPLHLLSPDELSHYAESVFLTAGSAADFRYFLPRILEILITQAGWWPSPEVVGRTIYNGWETFSERQQKTVLSFFTEAMTTLVASSDGHALDEWICGIARANANLKTYLELIEKNTSALVALYEQNSESLNKGKLTNSFWDGKSPNEKIVMDWFQSQQIQDLINAAYGLK